MTPRWHEQATNKLVPAWLDVGRDCSTSEAETTIALRVDPGVSVNGHRTWGIWLAATLGSFAWWEHKALQDRGPEKPSVTLTATMRCWIGVKPRGKRRFVLVPAFAGFIIFLWGHFLHGKFGA